MGHTREDASGARTHCLLVEEFYYLCSKGYLEVVSEETDLPLSLAEAYALLNRTGGLYPESEC